MTTVSPYADRSGRISWFGGPGDPTSGPITASGDPVSTPGIAVYDQSTLGGWWMVRMPNGTIAVVKQTDIGPAPSTGRQFDFTYSVLGLLGYNQSNFPTNSTARGVYLGKSLTNVSKMLHPAAVKLGANSNQITQLIQAVDVGSLERGHTVAVKGTPGAQLQSHDPTGTASGSEAVYSPIIPDPGVTSVATAISNAFNFMASGHFLLMLFGGAIVIVAVIEVGHVATGKIK